ncbi:MAG: hypothetical protein ACI88S_001467 [Ilumatobacter sp.]|jgi:hypothetical protein
MPVPAALLNMSLPPVIHDISPGAKVPTRLTTVDQHGQPVATMAQDAIYLGVPTDNVDHPDPTPPAISSPGRRCDPIVTTVDVAAGAAHVYTAVIGRGVNIVNSERAAVGKSRLVLPISAVLMIRADRSSGE